MKPVVAVVGATGVIGSELLSVLTERRFPAGEVRLFASADSVGEVYSVLGDRVAVSTLSDSSFDGVDIVFFAVNPVLVEKWAESAGRAGAYVIDVSGALPQAVTAVPEVNPQVITRGVKILANPIGTAVMLAPVLQVIQRAAGLKRVVVSTYEAVSGAGKLGLDELWEQTRAIYAQREIVSEAFPHQIAFNCLPQVDLMLESGRTRAEQRLISDLGKILGADDLSMSATAVRVPVLHGCAASVNVEAERPLEPEALTKLLGEVQGITVLFAQEDCPTHLAAVGNDDIYVGRVRRDLSLPHGLDMWIVADNIRRCAAWNAVRIAEVLVERLSQ
jgi:aspartate-semialdehyde dehydrogenase